MTKDQRESNITNIWLNTKKWKWMIDDAAVRTPAAVPWKTQRSRKNSARSNRQGLLSGKVVKTVQLQTRILSVDVWKRLSSKSPDETLKKLPAKIAIREYRQKHLKH